MRNLVLSVEIYKVGFLRDYRVAAEEVKASFLPENRTYKNEVTYVKCTGLTKSKYYGVAFAEADIDGQHLRTLHVATEKTNKLNCAN